MTKTITRRPIATLPEVREESVLIYCYPRPYPRPDCAEVGILPPDACSIRADLVRYGYPHWSPLPPLDTDEETSKAHARGCTRFDGASCIAWAREGACPHVPKEEWLGRTPRDGEWTSGELRDQHQTRVDQ